MPGIAQAQCKVECLNANGQVAAILLIDAIGEKKDKEPELLEELPKEEAESWDEPAVQLRENGEYRCRIQLPDRQAAEGWRLRENRLIKQSKIGNEPDYFIRTRSSAGTLSLIVEDEASEFKGRGLVEIRSIKLDYREEFRGMVCGIAEHARELLFQLGAATEVSLHSQWSEDPPTLVQQIEFLRGILYGGGFWRSLDRLLQMPHERLEAEPEIRPISRIGAAGSQITRQLASGQPRAQLPETHPLSRFMRTVPTHVAVRSKIRTTDTPENRFIKHALQDFSAFLEHALEILNGLADGDEKSKYELVAKDCRRLRNEIGRRLSRGLFKELSQPRYLPLGSPVLQKKAGYREVFQAWLGFRATALLHWEGAEDAFGGGESGFQAGKKDLPALYEAWLFFELFALFREKFQIDKEDLENFLKPNGKLGEFTLKQGVTKEFSGHDAQGLKLKGCFQFNRSFPYSDNPNGTSSWTRVLRPDYTMSFWPEALEIEEAEANGTVVHIHFDAKYRVHSVSDLFGKVADDGDESEDDLTEQKRAETEGNYKRADLLKMHAYRDAIRRSEGAYVLYPGKIDSSTKEALEKKENRRWKGFHELLPGLGAFAIRPNENGSASGMEHVSEFLDDALKQLSNRASRLSHSRYGERRASASSDLSVEEPQAVCKNNQILEWVFPGGADLETAAETIVLCGVVRDNAHLEWVKNGGHYNFRFDKDRDGYLPSLIPDFPKAKLLMLFHTNGEPIPHLWRIRERCREVDKDELESHYEYPRAPTSERYLLFPVKMHDEVLQWDSHKIETYHPWPTERRRKGRPFQLTLKQLISALDS